MALLDLEKLRKDINILFGYVRCLMAKSDENCPLVATEWSANHTNITGNPYTAGTYVFWNGHVYKCLFNNEGLPPTNTTYWLDLGEGHLLAEEESNWNSTGGRSFILNKPTTTSEFINNGEDGINPFITLADVPGIAVTLTSELTNDGEDGVNPFISLLDLTGNVPTLTSELTNDGDDGINPFISLVDVPYQIEKYLEVLLFPVVGNDNIIYLAEDTGIFYLWNGETGLYDQITSNVSPTGLKRFTQGSKTGWVLIGRNRNYYGFIGSGAVDLSYSSSLSSILGATGDYSFAVGQKARALGKGSASVGGNENEALNDYNFIGGGSQSITSGKNSSIISGYFAIARSFCELAIGAYNTDYTPVSTTALSPTDRAFVIGAGTVGAGNTKDVFTVYKNGAVKFLVEALANITNLDKTGFFIFNSTDSNRPHIHNGTAWKGLAYTDEVSLKVNSSTATTGSVITFDTAKIFNTFTTPTTADITNDLTSAKIGVVQKIYSNKAVEPTYPLGWVKLGGDYTPSVVNIIYAEWSEGSRVEYWIIKG
jgi:hypothetical protein